MNLKQSEDELLHIYLQAILPDSVEHTDNPQCFPTFLPEVAQELENYCSGIEHDLIKLQMELNELKREHEQVSRERNSLAGELGALRWQVEYDKRQLWEIHNSKAWGIARFIHFFYGFALFKREIIKESKAYLDGVAASRGSDGSRHPVAMTFYHIMNGAVKTAKLFGIGGDKPGKAEEVLEEAPTYKSQYEDDEKFLLPEEQDVQIIAFYLPQFHTFPENDEWWGEGFTEWVNTKKAKQRFPGHYQPRTPHRDIGYYDLSDVETMKKQAALAKAHGISAFCLYYYWFDGKKLMEKPLENLMAHPEVDFPFCLCWANENWTRTWDGQQNSVLIQQNYSEENDINFIKDLKRYITDPRYLRCNGKPVILVYHAKILPNANKTFAAWRLWCRNNGVGEIQIWSCRTFIKSNEFKKFVEVDREVEFPPHMVSTLEMYPSTTFKAYKDDGYYYNYQKIITDLWRSRTFADLSPYPFYRCAMLGWDNSCRRETGYSVWQYFALESYHYWLQTIIKYTRRKFIEQERFIFINAWNEWAEGTYLEPDERFGYASINTTTRALCDLPPFPQYEVLTPAESIMKQPGKVLIHFHIFYLDLLEEISEYLENIPFTYDLEITTDSRRKRAEIANYLRLNPLSRCSMHHITVTRNVGRDVAPFFETCADKVDQYDFIGHFHTKKSLTVNWGGEWRHYLFDQLLGSPEKISAIFRRFDRDRNLGLYFPAPFPAMSNYMNWENNYYRCKDLLKAMGFASVRLPEHPMFPVGQMFWARTRAVSPIFQPGIIDLAGFEEEKNQITDTLAHATERLWKYVAHGAGYTTLPGIVPPDPETTSDEEEKAGAEDAPVKRLAIFVHYSKNKRISDADMYMLSDLKKCADIVFVNNGELLQDQAMRVAYFTKKVILRENKGYDFGAWRDALGEVDLDGYDELVLLNNSMYGPFRPFREIFGRMDENPADFWGMTEFPETNNPRREEAKALPYGVIPRHIQSYFLVFRKQVFTSDAFRDFWKNVRNETTLPNVVARCETRLSNHLEEAGFKSDVYLRTAARLQEFDPVTPEYNAIYCRPQDFLVLGFPFLKKNICYYMEQKDINETILLISKLFKYPTKNIQITARTR